MSPVKEKTLSGRKPPPGLQSQRGHRRLEPSRPSQARRCWKATFSQKVTFSLKEGVQSPVLTNCTGVSQSAALDKKQPKFKSSLRSPLPARLGQSCQHSGSSWWTQCQHLTAAMGLWGTGG